jgi:outer membrane protein TolC
MQIAIQFLILVSLSVPGAPADNAVNRGESLTFGQVLTKAVRLNRDLKRAGLDFALAKQDLRAAKGEYDPLLNAGISYGESTRPEAPGEATGCAAVLSTSSRFGNR